MAGTKTHTGVNSKQLGIEIASISIGMDEILAGLGLSGPNTSDYKGGLRKFEVQNDDPKKLYSFIFVIEQEHGNSRRRFGAFVGMGDIENSEDAHTSEVQLLFQIKDGDRVVNSLIVCYIHNEELNFGLPNLFLFDGRSIKDYRDGIYNHECIFITVIYPRK
jgi:hypothetical protein